MIDLLICFECLYIEVYDESSKVVSSFKVTQLPEPFFDKVLNEAGIPKAK